MVWHRITRILSATATVLLLGLGVTAGIAHLQGVQFLSVQSGSMVPTFSKGDLVAVTHIPNEQYAVGDVITFINPHNQRQTISHRLQRIIPKNSQLGSKHVAQTTFITKGDANPAADTPIHVKDVVGKVGFSLPAIGYAFDFARQPLGLLLLIYVPALSIIWGEMRRLTAYYKGQTPYTATVYQPSDTTLAKNHNSATKPAMAAGAILAITTVAATSIAIPVAHAALLDRVTIQDTSISTLVAPTVLNHPIISRVVFGGSAGANGSTTTTNNTNIQITNNNPQTATSGNATATGGGNATSGTASNTSTSSYNFNVSTDGSSNGGNGTPAPATVIMYNPTNSPVDVSDWKLTDNAGPQTLPANSIIAAKSTLTFTWPIANGLSRNSDRLTLSGNTSVPIDALSWGADTSQFNPAISTTATTASLNRRDPNTDTNVAADWATSP